MLHERIEWKDSTRRRFADAGLLAVAEGELPARAQEIVDIDLDGPDGYPILPISDPQYYRNHTERLRIAATNKSNHTKRRNITLQDWTQLYASLAQSTEKTCPLLCKELETICDLASHGIKGGYFNGPRGWTLVLKRLGLLDAAATVRTRRDQISKIH